MVEELKEQRCSNCAYEINLGVGCYKCNNSCSDCFEQETKYNSSCEFWEGKENGIK